MIARIPFIIRGEDAAPFYCLAYMDGIYAMTRSSEPATQGIYFCPSPQFSTFSLHVFAEDGRLVLYERGDDDLNSIEFVLLKLLQQGVEPYFWHLFPREQVEFPIEHQGRYEQHRTRFCLLLYHFRVLNHLETEILKKRVRPKFNAAPEAKAPYLNEETAENEEIMTVVLAHTENTAEDEND